VDLNTKLIELNLKQIIFNTETVDLQIQILTAPVVFPELFVTHCLFLLGIS
jgi:hypothetical protein